MTKTYWPHFGTVFLGHMILLLGGFQIMRANNIQEHFDRKIYDVQFAKGVLTGSADFSGTKADPVVKASKPIVKKISSNPLASAQPVEASSTTSTDQSASTGSGTGVGLGIESGVAGGKIADLRTLYKAELRARIDQNKTYPPLSKKLGQQGIVEISFTVLKDGSIVDIKMEKPSSFEALNKSALESVRKVGKYKAIPNELGTEQMNLKIPIRYVKE